MIDLSSTYLGLSLKNPLVVSPSPLCSDLDNIKRMEDASAAAIVLHSLFEEQLTSESQALNETLMQGVDANPESLSFFPDLDNYKMGPDAYLEHLRKAKEAVEIPIIASLNGVSKGGWTQYARSMEAAGADAIELNIYFMPTRPEMSDEQVRAIHEELIYEVKNNVTIPVAVKIAPTFSAIPHMAACFKTAGADGLVLFNRFYQPDFDLENLDVLSNLELSSSSELRQRLRWVAILYQRVHIDMAVSGGVHTPEDVVKTLMAGANVAMTTSALLKNGIQHLAHLQAGLYEWMEKHEYQSVSMLRGTMSQKSVADPAAFERANYMHILTGYTPSV